jgi:ABC-type nitrate/sulfonate/bicarbonate transport system permease component
MKKIKYSISFIVAIFLWWAFSAYKNHIAGAIVIPDPLATFKALYRMVFSSSGFSVIWVTIVSIAKSLFFVFVIGIPLSIFLGYYSNAFLYVRRLFSFLGSIPPVILFPIFYYQVFNSEESLSRIICVCFGCIPILVTNIADQISTKSKERIETAKLFGASNLYILKNIVFYELLSNIFTATKTALSFCIIIVIATELVAQGTGIGAKIIHLKNDYDYQNQFALILVIGIIGVSLNYILTKLEKKFIQWQD